MSDGLIVIDDLMHDAVTDSSMLITFTEGSHHKNISVVFLMQNIFHKGSHTRTMSINTQYMVLFKNPRDEQQIQTLARQVFGRNSEKLMSFYRKETNKSYGFVVLDLHPSTPINKRIVKNYDRVFHAAAGKSTETKSRAAQLIDLRLQTRENPYARPLLEAKEKYMNMMSDPTKHHSDYRDLKREYNSMLKRYRNAENGVNASSILAQKINEAKEIVEK